MQIGTCQAKPGHLKKGKLTVGIYNGKKLEIPIYIAKGKIEGKTMFISAGMHGDEINGIEVLKNFIEQLDPRKMYGTIIFLPIVNPWGFKKISRYIPFDKKDLNRCFNKRGNTISYKIAKTLMSEIISKCDFGVDIHDGRKNILLPHARIFKKEKSELLKEMSHAFGSDIILEREGDSGMMAIESFNMYKTPVLTVEVGGASVLKDEYTNQVVKGLNNILIYMGMIRGVLNMPIRQFFLDKRMGYSAPIQGILHINVELGDAVKKNELIAVIHDPIEDKEVKIRSKNHGIVFSIKKECIVKKEDSILSILHFKQKGRRDLVPIQAKMLINKTSGKDIIT